MSEFSDIIVKLISQGADPNELKDEFEDTVINTQEWGLWGDLTWRKELVCSKCGSHLMGICSDKPSPKITDFNNPLFHKNQAGITQIPLKEWIKLHPDNMASSRGLSPNDGDKPPASDSGGAEKDK